MDPKLKEKIQLLPNKPGVYKFLDNKGKILYIGKAFNLHARVSSYFRATHDDRPRIIGMIPLIADLETTETDNEIEALVLESALIRKIKPYYNSDLKDDKSYAWLYITTQDKYPTVKIVRTVNKKEFKRGKLFGPYPKGGVTKRVFNYLRKLYPFCTAKDPTKPCFYSRIGLCPGPDVTVEDYRKNIDQIIKFLQGTNTDPVKDLERKMNEYSQNMEYEKAAELRDKINDLKYLGTEIRFTYFNTEEEYVESREDRIKRNVTKLAKELDIDILERIECYDISNISGKFAYGSMVVSINGIPTPKLYRTFKIKSMDTPNDPSMLYEVLTRRVRHIGIDKDESLAAKPDLLLIDGGKSQLGVVAKIIPEGIKLMGISKGKRLKRKEKQKIDEFWKVNNNGAVEQIKIKNTVVLSSIRDEAHRFAILNHRRLRKYMQKKSVLDEIDGIGGKTRKKLIKAFGTISKIKKANFEEINKVTKNKTTTQRIIDKLR